jgi:GMP synthase (glutamine-hydrolysing)
MSKPVLIIRHVPHESAGTLENALTQANLEFKYLDLFREYPSSLKCEQYLGLVVMGGPMNVDEVEKHPFLGDDMRWIRQTIEAGMPLLGICLGSQLLAKACGARVYPGPVKEIGWYPLELSVAAAEDRLFAGCGRTSTVFQWHGDTFDLPPGAIHLAQSALYRNQAFRIGPSAYGLQFHIEMTAEMIEDWLSESGNCGELASLDYIDPELIRQKTAHELPGLQTLADKVLGRFAALCRERI